jgi:hypothetical protein
MLCDDCLEEEAFCRCPRHTWSWELLAWCRRITRGRTRHPSAPEVPGAPGAGPAGPVIPVQTTVWTEPAVSAVNVCAPCAPSGGS